MKKIFTFCFFAFALLIGTQSALAQDKVSTKQKAFNKAKELRSTVKFNDNTLEQVYNAYYAYEKGIISLEGAKNEEATAKLSLELQSNLKTALGEDVYKRFLNVLEKRDAKR